jgi:hypothetical protein
VDDVSVHSMSRPMSAIKPIPFSSISDTSKRNRYFDEGILRKSW